MNSSEEKTTKLWPEGEKRIINSVEKQKNHLPLTFSDLKNLLISQIIRSHTRQEKNYE
ncbi:MAG: hypothetical protein AB1633_07675 [Elusimicrobiota bacterium]